MTIAPGQRASRSGMKTTSAMEPLTSDESTARGGGRQAQPRGHERLDRSADACRMQRMRNDDIRVNAKVEIGSRPRGVVAKRAAALTLEKPSFFWSPAKHCGGVARC